MTIKISRGLSLRSKQIQELSEGFRPALSLKPAPYLPILETIGVEGDPIVIKAGTLIALDAWNNIVPANCGATCTIAYSETDATFGTLRYSAGSAEGAGAAVTTGPSPANFTLPANYAIGYAAYDMAQNQELNGQPSSLNYQIQTNQKGIVCDYLVSYPMDHANQMDSAVGDLIIPDNSRPGHWMPLKAADITANAAGIYLVMSNVVGKVMKVELLTAIDNLDKVETVPGFGLTGRETSGIPNCYSSAIADAGNVRGGGSSAKYKATINFNV